MTDISTSTYTPPGVYVTDASIPTVLPLTVSTTTVTIVGPALGYQTFSETVQVYFGQATLLTQQGIYTTAQTGPPAIAAPVVTNILGTVMVPGVDYTLVSVAGVNGAGSSTTIQRLSASTSNTALPSPNGLTDGAQVRISYSFTSPTYYTPQLYTDYTDIVAVYGTDLVTSLPSSPNASQVYSPVTLASRIALENGAASVIVLPTNPADGNFRAQLQAAYAKIADNYAVQILVPLLYDSSSYDAHTSANVAQLVQDVQTYIDACGAAGYGQIAFVGVSSGYDNTLPLSQLATQTNDKRIVLVYPNQMMLYNPNVGAATMVDGLYLAAACAGKLALQPVNWGLTRSLINSFTGLPAGIAAQSTTSFKNGLSSSGVLVVETNRSNALWVRHGVTTAMGSLLTQEISLVRIADTLLQTLQVGMENSGLIGAPIDVNMTTNVKAALAGLLETAVSNAMIVAYTNLAVKQQSTNPSVIQATFSYQPAVPLNYITVSFTVDLTSGITTASDSTLQADTSSTGDDSGDTSDGSSDGQ